MELNGKIIDFLGDSITEGVGVTDCINNRYDNRIKKMYGLRAVYNYGVSGTRFAHQSTPSPCPRFDLCFCGRAYDMERSADIVVVYGGVNDYIHGDAPIGSREDRTPATFRGAVWFLMNLLKTEFSNKTIVFMTPAHCCRGENSDSFPSMRAEKKSDAMPLIGYVNIIKETGKEFGIPVLDLFENLGINPNNSDECAKYTVDGLHFNDLGHEFLANALKNFLEAL